MSTITPSDIQPGDIITYPVGSNRVMETKVVHSVHRYDNGSVSLRTRFASNPRGIDWSAFIDASETEVFLVSRGVAAVDEHTRSLLP